MGTTPGDVRTNLKANEGDFEKKCAESFMGTKIHAIVEGCLEVLKKTEAAVKAVEFIVFAGLN